jgi:invasion protein IalB
MDGTFPGGGIGAGRIAAGRRARRAVVYSLAALALTGWSGAALAQGAVKDKHGAWETRCETPPGAAAEQCAVVQSVVDEERPNITLVVIALKTADRKSRLLRVIAPLGVLLPTGLGLHIDKDDFGRMSFVRCLPNGCVAEVFLDDKLLAKLENAQTATLVIFETPEEGVGVPTPLAGFKDAFEQLP